MSAQLDDIEIVRGENALRLYQFGTMAAKHYFCGICGIYTHHQRRSNPEQYGINLACLEGETPFLPDVPVLDGKNHPRDQSDGAGVDGKYSGLKIGSLRFDGERGRLL